MLILIYCAGHERSSHSAWGLFLVLLVTSAKLLLGQTLNQAACDVYRPKPAETLIHGECYGYGFSLLCVKFIFFWLYGNVGFERNIMYAKEGITSATYCNALTLQVSLSLHEK